MKPFWIISKYILLVIHSVQYKLKHFPRPINRHTSSPYILFQILYHINRLQHQLRIPIIGLRVINSPCDEIIKYGHEDLPLFHVVLFVAGFVESCANLVVVVKEEAGGGVLVIEGLDIGEGLGGEKVL